MEQNFIIMVAIVVNRKEFKMSSEDPFVRDQEEQRRELRRMEEERFGNQFKLRKEKVVEGKKIPYEEFFESNKNASAFAMNCFHTTEDALEYIELLRLSGAKDIKVGRDEIDNELIINAEGGPYADTLYFKFESKMKLSEFLILFSDYMPTKWNEIKEDSFCFRWD